MDNALELKPASGGRVAIAFLGLLCLGITALVVMQMAHPTRHDNPPLVLAIVFGAVALGLLFLAVRIGHRRVIIDRNGVEVRGVLGDKRIAWSAVSSYSFSSIDTQSAVYYSQGGLVAVLLVALIRAFRKKPQNRRFKGGRLVIHASDGTKVSIAPWFRDIDNGLERIFAELHPRLAPITGAHFGKLSFDGNTLSHPSKGSLALHEIEKVVVTPQGVISIRKVGKRLGWASVSMAKVTSSLLLFERLAQRGVVVDMSDTVFLPLPTLGVLSQLRAARENLPQARIQQR